MLVGCRCGLGKGNNIRFVSFLQGLCTRHWAGIDDHIMEWAFILRLLVAGLLGTAIGLDREYRVKDAGFRTHFLVSLGSALIMIVSQWGFTEVLREPGVGLDPSRIAAQVVSGIGFIGAGTIIFHRQIVRGLTTAASLWATAGIGLAVGSGLYIVAVAATLLTLVALEGLNLLFPRLGSRRMLIVFSTTRREVAKGLLDRLQGDYYTVLNYEMTTESGGGGMFYRVTLIIRARSGRDDGRFIAILQENPDVVIERIA